MAVTCTVSSSAHAFNLPRPTLRSTTRKASPPSVRISRRPSSPAKRSPKTMRMTHPRTRVYNLPVKLPQPILSSGSDINLLSKDFLASMRSSLKRVTTSCPSIIPTKDLGSSVTVGTSGAKPSTNTHFIMPTFCFAAYDGTQEGESFLYPCHALPALALCNNIERSQLAATPTSSTSSNSSTLSVVPLRLPDPKSFIVLRNFMYTRSQSDILWQLLPTPVLPKCRASLADPAVMSRALASSFSATAILRLAQKLHGVWGNTCTLGITDEELWNALQLAWSVVIGAMKLMNGRPQPCPSG